MFKRKQFIFLCLFIVAALVVGGLYMTDQRKTEYVTRASAAKVLALLSHSREECVDALPESSAAGDGDVPESSAAGDSSVPESSTAGDNGLPDVSRETAMAPYIYTVVKDGLMVCDGNLFYPMKMLTYKDALRICEKMGLDRQNLSFNFEKADADAFIPEGEWQEITALANQTLQTLEKRTAVLYRTSSAEAAMTPWTCETSEGTFGFEGLAIDGFVNQMVTFYVRDDEIAQILEVEAADGAAEAANAENTADSILNAVRAENEAAAEDAGAEAADEAGGSENQKYQDTGENSGNLAVFQGMTDGDLQTVRVALNTDGFQGLCHTQVCVTSDSDYTVVCGGQTKQYHAGETVTVTPDDPALAGGSMIISAVNADDGGKIQVLSLQRAQGSPSYRGRLVVTGKDGALILVNELPLEQYLYGVLPSEMPVSCGEEALKVQAVCARSFACKAILEGSKFNAYGADLDDSTSSQVYQNSGEDETACKAVDATKGQVLCSDGEIVKTYFFSTSCGVTSDVSDVWGGSEQAYLVPVFQTMSRQVSDLSIEENFRQFIDLKNGESYYESSVPWFRWSVTLDGSAVISGFSQVSGAYREGTAGGTVTEISVLERGSSGIAKKIVIHSENGDGYVSGEYSIRKALCVTGKTIVCHDGTQVRNQNMLPSGYFYIDRTADGQFVIHGGGFGHGVGMSQNGAAAMCGAGMGYDEVLTHFFAGTKIRKLPES